MNTAPDRAVPEGDASKLREAPVALDDKEVAWAELDSTDF
jgi:hypothetical protein